MLQRLAQRLDRDEEGFTLIELMVVVLIIAILIAIAIPTFLGARQRAQNRAAQSNIRNALTTEKTFYTDNSQYTTNAGGALAAIEPALTYSATLSPAVGDVGITVVSNGTNIGDAVCIVAKSSSGNYYGVMDESVSGVAGSAVGTHYYSSTSAAPTACTDAGGFTAASFT